jgi:serine phosphatase RsbU (regulator of sigma subunit)
MVVDVSQDWVAACVLQERFMENARVGTPGLLWDARCRQLRALGGDYFQFMPLPGRRVALSVADASGKGLPAAGRSIRDPILWRVQ